ncbi:MAG: hypothetical protein JWN70_5223 [Planctomycetaceae bacterium]|nr:hypothetical protein [Planctomycetaceae bacterium]
MTTATQLYGLLAQYDEPEALRAAASQAYAHGYRRMEAYSPFPVESLATALGHPRSRLPILTLVGGVLGGVSGYGMLYYASVISYPMNVGGRPLHSWPSFIPITFELTILGAALFTVFGMLALSGLPMPYHALFNVPEFKRASRDQFFLCIQSIDPQFDINQTAAFLKECRALAVHEVPR